MTASSTPYSCSASAALRGSLAPTAVRHSSRLPTATVAYGSACWYQDRASSRDDQNIGR